MSNIHYYKVILENEWQFIELHIYVHKITEHPYGFFKLEK